MFDFLCRCLNLLFYKEKYMGTFATAKICLCVSLVLNVALTQMRHFVTGCLGGKPAQKTENSEQENNDHILGARLRGTPTTKDMKHN